MTRVPAIAIASTLVGCTLEVQVGAEDPGNATPNRPEPVQDDVATRILCTPFVDFGTVPPGVELTQRVHCELYPPSRFQLQSATLLEGADPGFAAPRMAVRGESITPPIRLEPEAAVEIDIPFEGSRFGSARATLVVKALDIPPMEVVARAYVDRNVSCRLRIQPPVLDLGSVEKGSEGSSLVRVRNLSDTSCAVDQVEFLDGSHQDFLHSEDHPFEVEPGEEKIIRIAFKPETLGDRDGVLGLYGHRRVLLRGLPVRASGREVGTYPKVYPLRLDFGLRNLACVDPSARVFQIKGASQAVDVRLSLEGDTTGSYVLDSRQFVIGADESRSIPVWFNPGEQGLMHARLRVQLGSEVTFIDLIGEGADFAPNVERFTYAQARPFTLAARPIFGTETVTQPNGRPLRRINNSGVGHPEQWSIDYPNRQLTLVEGPFNPDSVFEISYEQACLSPTCGDGVIDPGEACDDANDDNQDECDITCQQTHCGDGYLRRNSNEECDDGNLLTGDKCNAFCMVERCGNGYVEPNEECDDGDGFLSDIEPNACRTTCVKPICGDGVVDTAWPLEEACDDGNTETSDACVLCQPAECGDGFVQAGVEECDDRNTTSGDGCEGNCLLPRYKVTTLEEGLPLRHPTATPVVDSSIPLTFPSGFDFKFLGRKVTAIDVSQPGLIMFGTGVASPANTEIPAPGAPDGFLAWWWDDHIQEGTIHYEHNGGIFSLYFEDIAHINDESIRLKVVVNLNELDGSMDVFYGPVSLNPPTEGSATVGWESLEGDRGGYAMPSACNYECTLQHWPKNRMHKYHY